MSLSISYRIFHIASVAVYHAVIAADPENKNRSYEDILAKYPPKLGITDELCAGIVDKSKPLIEIAREEVLEECGFNVPVERFELILSYRYYLQLHCDLIENKLLNIFRMCYRWLLIGFN